MQLRNRILLIMLTAMVLLAGAVGAFAWMRDARVQKQYGASLLQAQDVAWQRVRSAQLERLNTIATSLLADPALRAGRGAITQAVESLLSAAIAKEPGLRIDLFSDRGALTATTATGIDPQAQVELGWVLSAAGGLTTISGLSQTGPRQYSWILVRGFEGGVLALGADVRPQMAQVATQLGGDVFLANMRGVEVVGSRPGSLRDSAISVPVRASFFGVMHPAGTAMQVVSQPVANPDGRVTGALVWMQNAMQTERSSRQLLWTATGVITAFMALIATGLALYLRQATEPWRRSVRVLQELAAGRTDASLDEGEEDARDEAGEMAQGIAAIRSELLNLQLLRDERLRLRRQQERLIRNQMRTLADSLDPASRDEILDALGSAAQPAEDDASAATTQLAELAGILGRMSGLVSNQQGRLLKLLRDLQAAVETKALLASLQQELEIARQMQLSILPRSAPETNAVEIAATMIAAKEIGGDFYDYFLIDADHLAVVIADVSGKGVPAAFFMAISRTLLKSNALFLRTPGATIAALNDQLCAENEQMMFVTVFYSVVHLPSGTLRYVNAGHNPPIRLQGGKASFFPRGTNMALAVMEEQPYSEGEIVLQRGDTLLLYTDGVTEATRSDGVLYGDDALLSAVEQAAASGAVAGPALPLHIVEAVRRFEAGAPQADDVTIVAMTYRGSA